MNQEAANPPIEIAGFRLVEEIARGGMGSVHLARQISIDRDVAVKLLFPKYAEDRIFVERFLREARAAARLNHPNIVQAIDVGHSGGRYYFVMEFVRGCTLGARLREQGRFAPAEACEIVKQVARALEHAGRNGMLHLDVKPGNIMLAPSGLAKLADFGLARHVEEVDTLYAEKKVIFGTPGYMSPEQISGAGNVDARSDLFSLGVTFYELVTGTNPFVGADTKTTLRNVRAGNVPPACEVEPSVPEDVSVVIAKMMARDRDERYTEAATLLVDLDALCKMQPPPIARKLRLPAAEPAEEERPPPPRRGALAVGLFLAAVGVAAVLAGFLVSRISGHRRVPDDATGDSREAAVERHEGDPVPRRFRACVVEAERAVVQLEFAKAVRLYEEFAARHPKTRWAVDAQIAADDVRAGAIASAQALAENIDTAIARDDLAEARKSVAAMRAVGLSETQPIAEEAERRLRRAEDAARKRAERQRREAARAARRNLQQQLAALGIERHAHQRARQREQDYRVQPDNEQSPAFHVDILPGV